MINFRALDTLTIYSNISIIRLLIQTTLCGTAKIKMDLSKNNRFSVEEAMNFIPRTDKTKKIPVYEMLESSKSLSSPMVPILSWKLGTSTIPLSSKLELLCQYEMNSWQYIATKNSIVDPPLVCFFSEQNVLTKEKIKI